MEDLNDKLLMAQVRLHRAAEDGLEASASRAGGGRAGRHRGRHGTGGRAGSERDEEGSTTVEYAIGAIATAAFAGLLLAVLKSGGVKAMLTNIISSALSI